MTTASVSRPWGEVGASVVIDSSGRRGLAWGDRRRFVVDAVGSVLADAGDDYVEIVVVHDDRTSSGVLDQLRNLAGSRLRLFAVQSGLTRPERLNRAVLETSSDVTVLLDEATELAGVGFLRALSSHVLRGGHLAGPRVLRPDGRLQDAGLAFHGLRHTPMFAGWPADAAGPHGLLTRTHECSGLGASCMAMTRRTFEDVGGLSERFPLLWHIDLAHKVRDTDQAVLWTPDATLYQVFNEPVDPRARTKEVLALRTRWRSPDVDPFVPAYGSRGQRPHLSAANVTGD